LINLIKGQNEKKYAKVAILDLFLNKTFHYAIPKNLQENISYGSRVIVPFKKAEKRGCIVGFLSETKIKNCRDILQLLDEESFLSESMVKLTKWMADYYLCSWSKVFNYILPKYRKLWMKNWKSKEIDLRLKIRKNISESIEDNVPYGKIMNNSHIEEISHAIKEELPKVFFLGECYFSNKIDFYIRSIRSALSLGKQIIILIPSETDLMKLANPLIKEFKDRILVHVEKKDMKNNFIQWMQIKDSRYDIIIGKRSAVFLPVKKLGLIIIDQEQDALFKEERSPRYHAGKIAIKRAEIELFPIILHSHSPTLETFREIKNKHFIKVCPNKKIVEGNQVENKIIDMTLEKSKKKVISYQLQQSIVKTLKNNKKVILFLNRRGFSNFLLCNSCGYIPTCPHCQNSFTCHYTENHTTILVCHACGKKIGMLHVCPKCGSKEIRTLGIGTQQLEDEIKKMFTRSHIKRLDRDIIKNNDDYVNIVDSFNKGEIDILIGTQMAVKGVSYENVKLLGFVSADTILNLPDFRSGEKTFQMIKVINSSFRKDDSTKEVIIQTFNPNHHCFSALKKRKDNLFYKTELSLRKELEYPPYTHIIKMEIKGEKKKDVLRDAQYFAQCLEEIKIRKDISNYEILGAKNMVIWKTKGYLKVQLIIKIKNIEKFNRLFLKSFDKKIIGRFNKNNQLLIDVDPVKMT